MSELRLVLVRHAKTEQQGPPAEGDHGRRLTPRGVSDARAAGQWLLDVDLRPDLVLCSTAARAEQTWRAMTGGTANGDGPPLASVAVWREHRLYQASAEELVAVLSEVPEEVRCLAMVGHAPGIPDLVSDLTDWGRADPHASSALDRGYPTMTCAVLHASASGDGAAPGSMVLSRVHTARGAH